MRTYRLAQPQAGSGRRAREVIPEAIRAASAWRVAGIEGIGRDGCMHWCAAQPPAPALAQSAIAGVTETRTRMRLPGSRVVRVRYLAPL